MLGGGINNIDIINASQREARGKLEQMAGIKRPPSGILASSTELMNAVGNAAAPAMPVRATGPTTPMTPAPVQQAQVALPQVAAPTTVTPGPVQQAAPAPRPMAPAPQPQQQPVMMNEGGFMTVRKRTEDDKPVDIGISPVLAPVMALHGGFVFSKMMDMFGSEDNVEEQTKKKANIVTSATNATDDPKQISDAVMIAADVTPTNENKKDFATNVFGLDDVNDIDEINRRIADVAMSSAIGKGPDEFASAILLGLQNYKQTASARAAGTSGGVKSANYRSAKNAYQDAFTKAMGVSDVDIPEGMTKEQYATQFAETVVSRTYTPEQIAAAGITMGSIPSGGGAGSPPVINTQEEFDALPSGTTYIDNGVEYTKP